MRIAFTFFFILFSITFGTALSSPKTSFDPVRNQTLWDSLLHKYVHVNERKSGVMLNTVDYDSLSKNSSFSQYISSLKEANITSLNRTEFYSFFINVYNALAVNMILEHPCKKDLFGDCGAIKSIRDIGTYVPYKPVWEKEAGTVGGKKWTLDDVEGLLRDPKSYNLTEDPRLHAAIVCASISCPNLRNEAYTFDKLDEQLTDNFNNFLSNTKKGMKVDQKKKKVVLSSIFKWFESDFKNAAKRMQKGDSVLDFILIYLYKNHTDYDFLVKNKNDLKISHFDYNWNVNAEGDIPCSSKSRACYQLWALLVTLAALLLVVIGVGFTVYCVKRRKRTGYHSLQ